MAHSTATAKKSTILKLASLDLDDLKLSDIKIHLKHLGEKAIGNKADLLEILKGIVAVSAAPVNSKGKKSSPKKVPAKGKVKKLQVDVEEPAPPKAKGKAPAPKAKAVPKGKKKPVPEEPEEEPPVKKSKGKAKKTVPLKVPAKGKVKKVSPLKVPAKGKVKKPVPQETEEEEEPPVATKAKGSAKAPAPKAKAAPKGKKKPVIVEEVEDEEEDEEEEEEEFFDAPIEFPDDVVVPDADYMTSGYELVRLINEAIETDTNGKAGMYEHFFESMDPYKVVKKGASTAGAQKSKKGKAVKIPNVHFGITGYDLSETIKEVWDSNKTQEDLLRDLFDAMKRHIVEEMDSNGEVITKKVAGKRTAKVEEADEEADEEEEAEEEADEEEEEEEAEEEAAEEAEEEAAEEADEEEEEEEAEEEADEEEEAEEEADEEEEAEEEADEEAEEAEEEADEEAEEAEEEADEEEGGDLLAVDDSIFDEGDEEVKVDVDFDDEEVEVDYNLVDESDEEEAPAPAIKPAVSAPVPAIKPAVVAPAPSIKPPIVAAPETLETLKLGYNIKHGVYLDKANRFVWDVQTLSAFAKIEKAKLVPLTITDLKTKEARFWHISVKNRPIGELPTQKEIDALVKANKNPSLHEEGPPEGGDDGKTIDVVDEVEKDTKELIIEEINIDEETFRKYVVSQVSGGVSMADYMAIARLSKISEAVSMQIMYKYKILAQKYPHVLTNAVVKKNPMASTKPDAKPPAVVVKRKLIPNKNA